MGRYMVGGSIYIYIYRHMGIHIYIYIYTHVYICIRLESMKDTIPAVYMHTYIHTYIHIYICMYVSLNILTCVYIYAYHVCNISIHTNQTTYDKTHKL